MSYNIGCILRIEYKNSKDVLMVKLNKRIYLMMNIKSLFYLNS